MPQPYRFEGFTPYAVAAAEELGVAVTPAQLATLRPLATASSLVSQAFHRDDLSDAQRADIVKEARHNLGILQVAARTAELVLEQAEERLTAPAEAAAE